MKALRKLRGDALFNGQTFSKAHVLVVREDGVIEDLVPEEEAGDDIETHAGILLPGLINCHCHLELSHLKGVVAQQTGLVPFLLSVIGQRSPFNAAKAAAIEAAEKELFQKAIVAVADICNTTDAIAVKEKSALKWHNLVEVANLRDAALPTVLANYQSVAQAHADVGLAAVLTPHAPYSVSAATFAELNNRTAGQTLSIHNCETLSEDELFMQGTGAFLNLYKSFGFEASPLAISRRSSVQSWLPYFTNGQTLLLVHNTFMREADIVFANQHAAAHNLTLLYCLCPNANLYIENVLPPVDLFLKHNCTLVLGTDSYGSNSQLNIMSEVTTIRNAFPHVPLETLLRWATGNAIAVSGFEDLGNFKKGTTPGVALLNEADLSIKRLL